MEIQSSKKCRLKLLSSFPIAPVTTDRDEMSFSPLFFRLQNCFPTPSVQCTPWRRLTTHPCAANRHSTAFSTLLKPTNETKPIGNFVSIWAFLIRILVFAVLMLLRMRSKKKVFWLIFQLNYIQGILFVRCFIKMIKLCWIKQKIRLNKQKNTQTERFKKNKLSNKFKDLNLLRICKDILASNYFMFKSR